MVAQTATLTVVCGLLVALAFGGVMQMPAYRSDLQLFEQIANEYPDFYYGNLGVGIAHQKAGHPELALRPLQRAVRRSGFMQPDDERRGQAERWLGLAYLTLGRTTEAVAQLAQAAELDPEDAQIQVNLAVAYLQMGRMSDAESALETALTLDPEFGEAELNLGIVLGQRAAHALALPHFRRAAAMLPGLADAHYNLGNGYARVGRTNEAIESYRRALQIQPNHAAALSNLRVVMARQRAP